MYDTSRLKKSRKNLLIKNIVIFALLIIGVIYLCLSIALIQNTDAERTQRKSSERILDEVSVTLRDNDATVTAVFEEYNKINQTTLNTLARYVQYIDIMSPLSNAGSMTEQELAAVITETTGERIPGIHREPATGIRQRKFRIRYRQFPHHRKKCRQNS